MVPPVVMRVRERTDKSYRSDARRASPKTRPAIARGPRVLLCTVVAAGIPPGAEDESGVDRGHLDTGVPLAVAGFLLVCLLCTELLGVQFLALDHRLHDLGGHGGLGHVRLADCRLAAALADQEDLVE